jgi:hypothetical protein
MLTSGGEMGYRHKIKPAGWRSQKGNFYPSYESNREQAIFAASARAGGITLRGRLIVVAVLFSVLEFYGCGARKIDLGGMSESRTVYTVYILGGQSNMLGSSTPTKDLPPSLQVPQEDIQFYFHSLRQMALPRDKWIPLQPGSSHDFGPEVTFGRSMADASTAGARTQYIALIKYAVGNSNLDRNWGPNSFHFKVFLATVKSGLRALTSRGDRYRIAGMLWMQGESDSIYEDMAKRYEANLTRLIDNVRAEFNAPHMPIVIGRIFAGNGTSSVFLRFAKLVRAAQMAVADRDPQIDWIDLDDLPQQDAGVEFNCLGMIELGRRFGAAMQKLTAKDYAGR